MHGTAIGQVSERCARVAMGFVDTAKWPRRNPDELNLGLLVRVRPFSQVTGSARIIEA